MGCAMGYDRALSLLHGFSLSYLKSIKVRYVCDIMRRTSKRVHKEKENDALYKLYLNHRIDAKTFLMKTSGNEPEEVTAEEVIESAEATIQRFAGRGK